MRLPGAPSVFFARASRSASSGVADPVFSLTARYASLKGLPASAAFVASSAAVMSLPSLSPHMQRVHTGLAAITLQSPEQLEEVPGIVAHLTRLLANRGINIVEMASCYTDTVLVIEKQDVATAMEALGF